jgi:RNA polymerase sigma-70 factor, ECF subfamily
MNPAVPVPLPTLLKIDEEQLHNKPSAAQAEITDESLMDLICKGDKEALGSLFRRHARVVRGVAYRVLRDPSEADDLLQDIFVLIYRLCQTFDRSKGPARFWILQMTYRRAISRRRYLTSRHFYTRLDLDEAAETYGHAFVAPAKVQSSIDEVWGREGFEKILKSLSGKQRHTLRLFFVEGYTFDEIAAEFGETAGNVRHHYYRGLEKLRRQIFRGHIATETKSVIEDSDQSGSGCVDSKRTP